MNDEAAAFRLGAFVGGTQYRLVAPPANNLLVAIIFQAFSEFQDMFLQVRVNGAVTTFDTMVEGT